MALRRDHLTVLAALAAVSIVGACLDVGESYDDFLSRADRTPPELAGGGIAGVLVDVTGDYLLNIALKPLGDVYLPLRITFTGFDLDPGGDHAGVTGEFRFQDESLEDPPLASFETTLDDTGRMSIDLGRVFIPVERSPIEDTAVEVDFSLEMIVLDETNLCGFIEDEDSQVLAPIVLDLRGTTFGGLRYGPQGQVPTDIPTECPASPGGGGDSEPDAGTPDAGPDVPDELVPPDVDLGPGTRADVTGRYWMKVAVGGAALALDLIADLQYFEGLEEASLDGSLRGIETDPGAPAVATFTTPVDENGEFTVVIRNLTAPSALGQVVADIALRGIIVDTDTLCGAADGAVSSPLQVDLAGTTFGAVRIPPGTVAEPENTLDDCP